MHRPFRILPAPFAVLLLVLFSVRYKNDAISQSRRRGENGG